MMNVLLLGSGGRENALAHILSKSPILQRLYIAPGNPGTAEYGINVPIGASDFPALYELAQKQDIRLIVCGPEDPLVKGVYDFFKPLGIPVVGPSQFAAQLEGSKSFAKQFMQRHNIPTASYREFDSGSLTEGIKWLNQTPGPYVLKADGLAAGKGVVILTDREEAKKELSRMITEKKFGEASARVVIESFLQGIEFSVFALTDGKDYLILPEAKDYKRIGEGDTGLNTGGMGAVSPVPFFTPELRQLVEDTIVRPTISGLLKDKIEYKGFLYFGLILTDSGPQVIEYNCRMGDPETEAVMPRIISDILPVFLSLFDGSLKGQSIQVDTRTAITVIVASGGYPEAFSKNLAITWEPEAGCIVYQAGTTINQDQLVTSGGRVLALTALGESVNDAVQIALQQADKVLLEGKYYRRDIGFEFR